VPSRFLDELPEAHVEVTESKGGFGGYGGYGASRFDDMTAFGSNYTTPGWQRAQGRRGRGGFDDTGRRYGGDEFGDDAPSGNGRSRSRGRNTKRAGLARGPVTIEGELVAKSTGTTSPFATGDRVFHQKFGYGEVALVDGNKLTIQFDKAGEKRVVDSFVERA
jgi:ATP-dependent DNA helicase UvrD/PcrA